MLKYNKIKKKAIDLRKKGLALGEIAKRVNCNKSTVYYWIKHIPIEHTEKQSRSQKKATRAMMEKYKRLRSEAYREAYCISKETLEDKFFRDFIVIYMCEGYRKSRNDVSVANSDPKIIKLSHKYISELSDRKIRYSLQYHVDQNINDLKRFWINLLKIKPGVIEVIRKTNSGNLSGRNWASKYGVFTVKTCDTYLRSKIQAWMDYLQNNW